ncbi:threonine repeat-containing protein [Cryptosporidium canis]|uniref:Threonine repeat-containing protein n=1 Tax=Cryptosporidium canis TaxID=195482 RepID=A0A9D5HYN5_9CRYT|nr:threonine repeat-containing protein [Cryptosporidium canis]
MDSKVDRNSFDTIELSIENNCEDEVFEKCVSEINGEHDTKSEVDSLLSEEEGITDCQVRRLEIIQRKTSKSLLRARHNSERIHVVLFFVGLFGLPIISWGVSWIIGKTCAKPKSHRGKKLRQLNGILSLVFIFIPAIFGYFYYHTIVISSYKTNSIFVSTIENIDIRANSVFTSTETKTPKPAKSSGTQILSCSSDMDVEIVLWRQIQSKEKGLVLFIGKILADTWLKSNALSEAFNNGFTVAAISPPGFGKSDKIIQSRNKSHSEIISASSFLFWLVNGCLKFDTRKMVLVTHSNSITQKYVVPFIMSYPIAGIVFFNTNMGIKWFSAKNPMINDHLYYQPINFNNTMVRYIGDKEPLLASTSSVDNHKIGDLIRKNDDKVLVSKKINLPAGKRPISSSTTTTATSINIEDLSHNFADQEDGEQDQTVLDEQQQDDSSTLEKVNGFLETALSEKSSENSLVSDENPKHGTAPSTIRPSAPVNTTLTTKRTPIMTNNTNVATKRPSSNISTTNNTTTKRPTSNSNKKRPASNTSVNNTTTRRPTASTTTKTTITTTTKKPGGGQTATKTTTRRPGGTHTTTKKPGGGQTTTKTTTRRPGGTHTVTTQKVVTATTTKRPTVVTTRPAVSTARTTKSTTVKNMQSKQQYQHAKNLMNRRVLGSKGPSFDRNYDKGVSNITRVMNSCIAPDVTYKYDQRWYLTEQNKMGPFGWFDGKYTIPGWKTMQMAYESFDFDNLNSKRLSNGTYLLTLDYFKPLIETLNEILPLIAQRVAISNQLGLNNTKALNQTESSKYIQEAPTTWSNHRQDAYIKYRANFELVPAQEIYCI